MKRFKVKKEYIEWVRANGKGKYNWELVELFKKAFPDVEMTAARLRAMRSNHGINLGHPCKPNIRRRKIKPEHEAFIRKNAKGLTSEELADKLNKHFGTNFEPNQIFSFKCRHKITSGIDTRFQKGKSPQNKGKTWDDFMSPEAQEKSRKTTFKKGRLPQNICAVGTETLRSDGYVWVKMAEPKYWRQKHRILWEQHHGPIPERHRVIFLDGNRENIVLENLALIPQSELSVLNRCGLIKKDAALTQTGIIIARLKIKTTKREGKTNGNKKQIDRPQ